ncbi:Tyrosine recombinase XerD [compost metagenome]
MNENLKLIAEKAKISKELSFHTARHTFATLFLAAGGNIAVLKELMGHAAIKTTMVYVHIDAEQRKQQMSLMESL